MVKRKTSDPEGGEVEDLESLRFPVTLEQREAKRQRRLASGWNIPESYLLGEWVGKSFPLAFAGCVYETDEVGRQMRTWARYDGTARTLQASLGTWLAKFPANVASAGSGLTESRQSVVLTQGWEVWLLVQRQMDLVAQKLVERRQQCGPLSFIVWQMKRLPMPALLFYFNEDRRRWRAILDEATKWEDDSAKALASIESTRATENSRQAGEMSSWLKAEYDWVGWEDIEPVGVGDRLIWANVNGSLSTIEELTEGK